MKSDFVQKDYSKKILTIPNALSLFRLLLIPVMIRLYCWEKQYKLTTLVLFVSGVTDVVDGFIARRFNMVSDFGKAFDPVADKLTQISVLYCLVSRFKYMLIPLVMLVVKEAVAGVLNLVAFKKTGVVIQAVWHGKLNTVLLYSMLFVHVIWYTIPFALSNVFVAVCTAMMILSAILYARLSLATIKEYGCCTIDE